MCKDISVTYNGYSKNLSGLCYIIPWGGLIQACHYNTVKEWGAIGYQSLTLRAKSYEPLISSSSLKVNRNRDML